MDVLLKRVLVAAAIALTATACSAARFRMRVAAPAGAQLVVLRGPFSGERTLPIPFVATFEPMGAHQHYDVRLRIPAEVATRLGARSAVELRGELRVYAATELARQSVAELPIDEERLGRLVRGETAEAWWVVHDPNVTDGQLAHLVVHAPTR